MVLACRWSDVRYPWSDTRSENPWRSSKVSIVLAKIREQSERRIGTRVRAARQLIGLSQADLGGALGISSQQIQKYERGTDRISASRLCDIATVLQASVPSLLGLDESEEVMRRFGFLEDLDCVTLAQDIANLPAPLRAKLSDFVKVVRLTLG